MSALKQATYKADPDPDARIAAIAERTIGLMLALGHRFRQGQASINRGSFTSPLATDLHRKTVGVIGLGRVVTLHARLSHETRFLIRDQTLRLMKPTAFVLNMARAGLVEDRDLLLALENRELAGAGLDVFMSQSDPSYHHVTHELASLPNVIALPIRGFFA